MGKGEGKKLLTRRSFGQKFGIRVSEFIEDAGIRTHPECRYMEISESGYQGL